MTSLSCLSILKNLKRFLPVLSLCLGLLLLVPSTAPAQGILGGAAGDRTAPLSSYSLGNLGAGCGHSCLEPSLGIFSAGYDYNSFNYQGGIGFDELSLRYYLPWRISKQTFITPFALAYLTDLKESAQTYGLANNVLCFGGSWNTRLRDGLWVGARGEYDATRREGTWYSGGLARIQMFQFVGPDLASFRLTYYAESAGDQLIFPISPSGYSATIGYSHELFYCGPRLILHASVYDCTTGQDQRGWSLSAALSMARGLVTLRGRVGHDSVFLDNYTVGGDVNCLF